MITTTIKEMAPEVKFPIYAKIKPNYFGFGTILRFDSEFTATVIVSGECYRAGYFYCKWLSILKNINQAYEILTPAQVTQILFQKSLDAIKAAIEKVKQKEVSFPLLARLKSAPDLIVLFTDLTHGVVIKSAANLYGYNFQVGNTSIWETVSNYNVWEILPKGTEVVLKQN